MINYKQKFEQLWQIYSKDPINNSSLSEMLVYLSDKDSEIELEKLHNKKIKSIFEELEKSGIYQLIQKVLFEQNNNFEDFIQSTENNSSLKDLVNRLKSKMTKSEFDALQNIKSSLIDPIKLEICNLIEDILCLEFSNVKLIDVFERLSELSKDFDNFQLIKKIIYIFNEEQNIIFNQIINLINGEEK